jgi:hypothetical protein
MYELSSQQACRRVLSTERSEVRAQSLVQAVCQPAESRIPRSQSRASERMEAPSSIAALGASSSRLRSGSIRRSPGASWRQVRSLRASRTQHEYQWALVPTRARPRSCDPSDSRHALSPMQHCPWLRSGQSCLATQVGRLSRAPAGTSSAITGNRSAKSDSTRPRYVRPDQTSSRRLEADNRRSQENREIARRHQVAVQRSTAQPRDNRKDQTGTPRAEALRRGSRQYASGTATVSRQPESMRQFV